MAYKKVIIVGGGFAGINAAKYLGNTKNDVWIIDKTNHHLFQPLLYEVATAALSPADIATPIREILKSYPNETVIMGEVTSIEKEKKRLHLKGKDFLDFDYLILATGARHSYFGKNEWEKYAPGIKTISDALNIREKILLSFEKAERCDVISESKKYLNFVIIGGGPTGVEVAGALAEIAHETLYKNFRRIDPSKTKIYLIEALPHILPMYPEKLSFKAKKYLEKFGVKVLTNKKVTNITENGVDIEGHFIETVNVIWAAGNQASSFLQTLNTPLDKQGRVLVNKDLSIPDFPDIFVVGDAAHALDKNKKTLPALAPTAIQQGRYVAKIIKKQIPFQKRKPFQYFDKGSLAQIGKTKAVGVYKKVKISGSLAWFTWSFIHIAYLISFRNRLFVLFQWFFSYLVGQRGARLIHRCIDTKDSKENP